MIDLRGIADGSPEDGIAAARLFVKSGVLAVRAGRGTERVTTNASPGDGAIATPVVLLVSNGTANGAEVFAAAMVGNTRAELVGEPTAGIAAVQKLVRLPQNYGLWLTTERYLTVDGAGPIHERGAAAHCWRPHPDRRLRRSAADDRRAAQQGGRAAEDKEIKLVYCQVRSGPVRLPYTTVGT